MPYNLILEEQGIFTLEKKTFYFSDTAVAQRQISLPMSTLVTQSFWKKWRN